MSAESIVYAALVASAALTAHVTQPGSPSVFRIYPGAAPQTSSFPLVVYRRIAAEPVASLGGSSTLTRWYMQVDCYAASLPTAIDMADAVSLALFGNFDTFKGIAQNARAETFDEELRVFGVSQDFAIWAP